MAPTDEELLELMPQGFRDDLALVSRMAAHGAGPEVQPGLFRVSLNTGALGYARAVWDRARAALAEPDGPTLQLPEQAPDEHPPSNLDRREVAAWYHGHGCGWQAARAVLARWGHQPAPPAEREHEVARPTQDELWELWLRLDRELPDRPAAVAAFWEHAQVEARARCGRSAPAPDGEVAELVDALLQVSDGASARGDEGTSWITARAADLLKRLASPACVVLDSNPEAIAALEAASPGRIELLPEDAQVIEPAQHTILAPAPVPVALSERPWEREGWCDSEGRCWIHCPGQSWDTWVLMVPQNAIDGAHCLPATALPLPSGEVE